MPHARISEILIGKELITSEQFEKARRKAVGIGDQSIGQALVEMGALSEDDFIEALSEQLHIPRMELSDETIDQQVPHLVSEELLRRSSVFPVKIQDEYLDVAVAPPVDLSVIDEIELTTGYRVRLFFASQKEIQLMLNQHFNAQHRTRQTIIDMHVEDHIPMSSGELIIDDMVDSADNPPIVRLVVDIVEGAINERASDIHLEPQEQNMRVRYRVDGVLRDVMTVPRHVENSIISRIKILANMNITEKRMSQDGHLSIRKGEKEYDIRVATYLTINGEKVVMRLLSKDSMLIELDRLGLNGEDLKILLDLVVRPYGMVLITGPTGCGKTTTLYSVLNKINNQSDNIVTIEDPVEFKLSGINQSQVNEASGVTFATGLRSLLRQDPNIIMVGEIRDNETAMIATQASLTGHLVFSTLHTSNAPSAITRLLDMGIKEFLVSAALVGVVAQRLVRLICPYCKEPFRMEIQDLFKEFGVDSPRRGKAVLYHGKGCKYCNFTGYHGRVGLFEVMAVKEEIQKMILHGEPASAIRKVAVKEGMSTLRHSAFRNVVEGNTTLEEVRRSVFVNVD